MLVVGGENLIDLVQSEDEGGQYPIFKAIPGGSPFNMAIAAGRQQIPTRYVTPISTDAHGDSLFARLEEAQVRLATSRVDAASSLAMVNLVGGVPSYQFYRENTAERQINAEMLNAGMTQNDRVFHIGSLALAGAKDSEIWAECAVTCKKKGMLVSLDPNVRSALVDNPDVYRVLIDRMFGLADIIKCSDEDLAYLYQTEDMAVLMDKLIKASGAQKIITITQGDEGAYFFHDGEFHHTEATMLEPFSDTVGAGDTYMASMIAYLINGGWLDKLSMLEHQDKVDMAKYAANAAAINCSRQGCNPPTKDEIAAFMQA